MQAPRTSVIPKAAVEDAKTLSVNGSASQNGTGLDFDELTDLIRSVTHKNLLMASWVIPGSVMTSLPCFNLPIGTFGVNNHCIDLFPFIFFPAGWFTTLILSS